MHVLNYHHSTLSFDARGEDDKFKYQCVITLEVFGIKIEKKRVGSYTCYYAANRPFELAEMKVLVDAVQASKFISEKETKVLIRKLLDLVSLNDVRLLERDVQVPGRIKNMAESVYYTIDVLFRAMDEDRQLRFHYFRWNVQGKRELRRNGEYYTVSPFALHYDDEKYYLVAYDPYHNMIRHYRVDKMMDAEVLDKKRKGKTLYRQEGKAKYTQQHFRMYGGEMETVTLLCENEMANVIVDQFGHDVKMLALDEEHFTVDVEVAVSPQFYGWVVGTGGGVRIHRPVDILEQMKNLISE